MGLELRSYIFMAAQGPAINIRRICLTVCVKFSGASATILIYEVQLY